jgi:hypothetical protein
MSRGFEAAIVATIVGLAEFVAIALFLTSFSVWFLVLSGRI